MGKGCRKTLPYMDVFHALDWVDADGATSSAAPALPPKRQRVKGGIYAELTDSSSSSSSSSSSDASGDEVSPRVALKTTAKRDRVPEKFAALVSKLTQRAKDPDVIARMNAGPKCPVCEEGLLKPDAV